jgi:hypothetical protein
MPGYRASPHFGYSQAREGEAETHRQFTDKTRPLADACPEFSVNLSSADAPSGEIYQAQWKNESGPYNRAALLLNGIGTGVS